MNEISEEFDRLMERVRAGSEEAVRELYELYGPVVEIVVRRRLPDRLRRCYDTADFTQQVWASFFHVTGEPRLFPTPEALVAFLSRMACNKVIETSRERLGTQKHDMSREVSLSEPHTETGKPLGDLLAAPVATPSQHVMADERWQKLLASMPPGHRRVLELLRAGHSQIEIASIAGIDRRIIHRLVKVLERYFQGR
jgi:RNA polymerase sigma factor (sigma-70 family)